MSLKVQFSHVPKGEYVAQYVTWRWRCPPPMFEASVQILALFLPQAPCYTHTLRSSRKLLKPGVSVIPTGL